MELSECSMGSSLSDTVEERGRYNYGFPLVIVGLLRKIGMDTVLKRFERHHKLSYSLLSVDAL